MGFEDVCCTGLGLGLGRQDRPQSRLQSDHQEKKKKPCLKYDNSFPCLTLGPSEDTYQLAAKINDAGKGYGESTDLQRQASSLSAVSSFSNSSIKKERDLCGEVEVEVEVEIERVSSRASDEDEEGNSRKKLRLTKEQAVILEDSFKQHSTLNPRQKQVLAKQLNLRPRQVEVWFQNRRARTKLKQTEVDCELLRKRCETLTDENQRLQKELQELKALKLATPLYMQLPAATLTMCPSCERIGSGGDASSKTSFTIGAKPRFCNPFTHPSPAC
ncbi:homeobox-leucine zipper protein HAT22-like [Vitis riparia]|uniref:homeobox-leucine zipper protein HAT22-like n=1 Tax=Vitis riparia TaxID=96939 RepID=UPI00155ABC4F|nr:homeobox-leucine zipper protein HAT22-like [Vitis riparia]